MRINFQFDLQKAIEAMAYVVHKLGCVEKVKLTKLLYIADRDHFLEAGYPITGDNQVAMDYGPVPSKCLSALNGEFGQPDESRVFEFVQIINNDVLLRNVPEFGRLTDSERGMLDRVLAAHGHKYRWLLVEETHHYPEYIEHYVEGTSTPIPYESILKHYPNAQRFRHNRPVISREMASHMAYPFQRPEPEL